MTSPNQSVSTAPCPNCGAEASGRFCASCGASLAGAACASCGAQLSPGARFCHRCGTAVGTRAPLVPLARAGGGDLLSTVLPWAVAGVALLALIIMVAVPRFRAGAAATSAELPAAPGPVAPFAGGAAVGGAGGGAAPDISNMSPEERAQRLYNRVMTYDENGKKDSALFFAPMAIQAYQMLDSLDADARYDMGRIAMVVGQPQLARLEADSILRAQPTHLLGLLLAAQAARASGDDRTARAMDAKLVASAPAELAKPNPEYQNHRREIDAAVSAAKK